ncbi:hypothetical protein [Streptomyces sp. NPDC020983]|uniref:hypothetical protein n=1 Tax=Streptomyces sp. NPDC020983 TaxID=3365106 RepID=UPI00378BB0A9
MDIPAPVVAAQAAADKAWADLEAYRKGVDADRRKTAVPPTERHRSPELRPWTDEESARFAELHAAVVQAANARRDAMQDAGIPSTWDTERDIRAAARGDAE